MDAIDIRIDTKMTSMQTSLQNIITDKLDVTSLVAQVAVAIGGDSSPFVTAASLKLTMEGFITQVNARIDNLATIPKKPSKHKKTQDTDDSTMAEPDMEEEKNDAIAEAARKAGGRQ
jgi:hypothetical protein